MGDRICFRACVDGRPRSIDTETRTASFVAATGAPVEMSDGVEALRIDGVALERYSRNPVVLDSHDRWTVGAVIGRASVRVADGLLLADVTFAATPRADAVWRLVRDGFVRALSVAYIPRRVRDVPDGQELANGGYTVRGPARLVEDWELYEVSVVGVPADADAVRRSARAAGHPREMVTMDEVQVTADVPAPVATDSGELPPSADVLPDEVQARALRARREAILAITPRGLEDVAERLILAGVDIDAARGELLKAWGARCAPVGAMPPTVGNDRIAPTVDSLTRDSLIAALGGDYASE